MVVSSCFVHIPQKTRSGKHAGEVDGGDEGSGDGGMTDYIASYKL